MYIVSGLILSSTQKIEAICFSKTLVKFQRATRLYDLERVAFRNHCWENLKSQNFNNSHMKDSIIVSGEINWNHETENPDGIYGFFNPP